MRNSRTRRSRTRRVRRARKTTRKGMRGGANECKVAANQPIYDALIAISDDFYTPKFGNNNTNVNTNSNNNMKQYDPRKIPHYPRASAKAYKDAAEYIKNIKFSMFDIKDDEFFHRPDFIEKVGNEKAAYFIEKFVRENPQA